MTLPGSGKNNWRSGIHRRLHHPGFKSDGKTLCNIPSQGLDLSEETGEEMEGPPPIGWCRRCWYLRAWARKEARRVMAEMASNGPGCPQDKTSEAGSTKPVTGSRDAT